MSYSGKQNSGGEFQIEDVEIFENVAYIMAYHADNTISSTIEEWLDQFDMFSIYEIVAMNRIICYYSADLMQKSKAI